MEGHPTECGHFFLSLNAYQSQSYPNLCHSIAKVKSLLDDYPDGFTANAIRNLLGAFHFYNKSPEKALEYFQEVLKSDVQNLNALSNQVFVYKRLLRTKKADETFLKLQDAFNNPKASTSLQSAVQLAEYGFAYLFDCYMNNVRPRWKKCTSMFEGALNKVEEIKDVDKRLYIEIKFWIMQGYQKRYETDVRDQEHQDTFNKAVRIIHEIKEQIETDEMKGCRGTKTIATIAGVSLAYLGIFFFKKPNAKWDEKGLTEYDETKIPSVVQDLGLTEEFENPTICFENALKEIKDNREIRIRYATYLKNIRIDEYAATEENRTRLNEAVEHLDYSLGMDSTESNWFGRTTRGSVFSTKYKIFKDHSDLLEAIKDWEIAISFNPTCRIFKELAEAYRLLALKEGSTEELDLDKEEYITKASINFWKAVEMLGTEKIPEIHRGHGRFLRCLGDKREAIECFKRAMEIDTAHKPTKSFEHLFETFLQIYEEQLMELKSKNEEEEFKDNHRIELRVDRLLFEIAFWFRFAAVKKYNVFDVGNAGFTRNSASSSLSPSRDQKHMVRSFSVQADVSGLSNASNLKTQEAADLFEKHTCRFVHEYKQGMAHLCAYFEKVTEGSSDIISKMIHECARKKSVDDDEWKRFKETWLQRRSKLSQHKGLTCCPMCGNLTDKISFSEPPDKARNELYKYDFYVIYPENQREWVLYSLLQKLEGVYGFKGAIMERDALPGGNILQNTHDLIVDSHRVLVILSREFYTDKWCMHSLDVAETNSLDRKRENFIIPILLESVDVPDRFNTIICLDVVAYFDWDKLVRSISQR